MFNRPNFVEMADGGTKLQQQSFTVRKFRIHNIRPVKAARPKPRISGGLIGNSYGLRTLRRFYFEAGWSFIGTEGAEFLKQSSHGTHPAFGCLPFAQISTKLVFCPLADSRDLLLFFRQSEF